MSDGSEHSRIGLNIKTVERIEEMAAAIALIHNLNLNISRGGPVLLG